MLLRRRLHRGQLHRWNLRAVHRDADGDPDRDTIQYANYYPDRNPGSADRYTHQYPDTDQYRYSRPDPGTERDLFLVHSGWRNWVLFLLGAGRAARRAAELELRRQSLR